MTNRIARRRNERSGPIFPNQIMHISIIICLISNHSFYTMRYLADTTWKCSPIIRRGIRRYFTNDVLRSRIDRHMQLDPFSRTSRAMGFYFPFALSLDLDPCCIDDDR